MDFLKLIQDYGVTTLAMAGLAYAFVKIGGAAVEAIVRIIKNGWRRPFTKPENKPSDSFTNPRLRNAMHYDRPSLKTHYFFSTVNRLVTEDIENIDCGCEARTILFQDMCRIKVMKWRDFMAEFIDSEGIHTGSDRNSADGYVLGRDFIVRYQRWRNETEHEWLRSGIPAVAINAFDVWAKPRLDQLRDSSSLIASSAFYDDTTQRLACMMSIHEITVRLIVLDMNNVVYALNGRLDGHLYKNMRIIPIRDLVTAKIDAESAHSRAEEKFRERTTPDHS